MTCSAIVTNAIRRCQDHERRETVETGALFAPCIATTGIAPQKETSWVDPPVQCDHQRRTPVQSSPSYRVQQGRRRDRADRLNEGVKRLIIAQVFVCNHTSPRPRGAPGSNDTETLEWV